MNRKTVFLYCLWLLLTGCGGTGAIHRAASFSELEKVRSMLSDNPALVYSIDEDSLGETLMHCAVRRNSEKMVELLLEFQADIDAPRLFDGRTALHMAVHNDQPNMVELLLTKGAEPNIKDDRGNTALHLELEDYQTTRYEIVADFIQHDADLDLTDGYGHSAIEQSRYVKPNIQQIIYFKHGLDNYYKGQYSTAIESLNKGVNAVDTAEKLRDMNRAHQGIAAAEYFELLRIVYVYLSSAYMHVGDYEMALTVLERSRSRVFHKELARSMGDLKKLAYNENLLGERFIAPNLKEIQAALPADGAMLIFGNTDWQEMTTLLLTRSHLIGRSTPLGPLVESMRRGHAEGFRAFEQNVRGINLEQVTPSILKLDEAGEGHGLAGVVDLYRHRLLNLVDANSKQTEAMGKDLYGLLIKPFEKQLTGKKKLLLVPHGALSLIPFETLVDGNNQYLLQTKQISYASSVTSWLLLKKRVYEKQRRSVLALGGAIYQAKKRAQKTSGRKDESLSIKTLRSMSMRDAYQHLGLANWSDLPGTRVEIGQIEKAFPDAKLMVGKEVNERNLKQLSRSGELARFKVVHFATHGMLVPNVPELSALVLSQTADAAAEEDGYLRLSEIAGLSLRADLVNLSACQSGIGKIYSGEGVIGLSQSFFVAGAKSLAVTLWNVADDSTAKFMSRFYELVQKQQMDYPQALTIVKREFLAESEGPAYKAPYFWAPFVYYGP